MSRVSVALVSRHVPDQSGDAADRALAALVEGLGDAVDLSLWCWGPEHGGRSIPPPARWRPLPTTSGARVRFDALRRPRADVERCAFPVGGADVAVADDPVSWAAVRGHPRAVLTAHYSSLVDAVALRRIRPATVQDGRAERRAGREAGLTLAYSARVAEAFSKSAQVVPIAYPVPAEGVRLSGEPVAACVANWTWPPNARALGTLRAAWPLVRTSSGLGHARLLLAGRGLDRGRMGDGIEALGPVADSRAVLEEASVMVFPCPPTSGPKVKVLEALALGIPAVTTPGGVEGLHVPPGEGYVSTGPEAVPFAGAVARLLADPARAAALGRDGRAAVTARHAPRPAASSRLAALVRAWPELADRIPIRAGGPEESELAARIRRGRR